MPISLEIQGERKVSLQFDKFPTIAHDRLLERVTSLTARLQATILMAEPFRTGRLYEVTNVAKVFDNPGRSIRGFVTVSADFAKVATLEYGSQKEITVGLSPGRARARQAHRSLESDMKIPRGIVGAAYQRRLNITAHRFLRGSLELMADDIIIELQQAFEQATRESFV